MTDDVDPFLIGFLCSRNKRNLWCSCSLINRSLQHQPNQTPSNWEANEQKTETSTLVSMVPLMILLACLLKIEQHSGHKLPSGHIEYPKQRAKQDLPSFLHHCSRASSFRFRTSTFLLFTLFTCLPGYSWFVSTVSDDRVVTPQKLVHCRQLDFCKSKFSHLWTIIYVMSY